MTNAINEPLELVISMSVLDDLGINLYGNVPAVLSEVVANAWDADANVVDISYSVSSGEIVITDDGIGMTREELQKYYLTVGHKRRLAGRTKTPSGRTPMGRKGIGKLSLFSIAKVVQVETIKDGEKTAISMNVDEIKKAILAAQNSPVNQNGSGRYKPEEINGNWDFNKGTRITLKNLRKNRVHIGPELRRRLARRFYVIGATNQFDVRVSNSPLTISDRGYIDLIEYLWIINPSKSNIIADAIKLKALKATNIDLELGDPKIFGWIGTAKKVQIFQKIVTMQILSR